MLSLRFPKQLLRSIAGLLVACHAVAWCAVAWAHSGDRLGTNVTIGRLTAYKADSCGNGIFYLYGSGSADFVGALFADAATVAKDHRVTAFRRSLLLCETAL